MNSEIPDNDLLSRRIHELEMQVRRLKQFVVAAATVLVLLFVIVQVHDRHRLRTDEVVTRSITISDRQGEARARLGVFPEGSGMEIYAPSGEMRAQLVGAGSQASLNLYLPVTAVQEAASVNFFHDNRLVSSLRGDPQGASLELHSEAANGSAILRMQGTSAALMLSGADAKVPTLLLSADPTRACTALGGVEQNSAGGSFCMHAPGLPSLELADSFGNRAVVGIPHSADLSLEEASAASLILKHKSGNKLHVRPH
jgi:hypothetical protein